MNVAESLESQCITVQEGISELEGLASEFGTYLMDIGIPKPQINDWKVIFMEASANAVKHGKDPVQIRYYVQGPDICLEITHAGDPPPKEKLENITFNPDPTANGRGLFFIEQLSDHWEHWHGPSGYKQIIKKAHGLDNVSMNDTLIESSLGELSLAYESLTAFYQLGQSLLHSNNTADFIDESVESLQAVIPNDCVFFSIFDDLEPEIVEQLEGAKSYRVLAGYYKEEINWETLEELPKIDMLKEYGCGTLVPIIADNRCLGNLCVARTHNDPYLNAHELSTIRTFADLFGIAIAQANNSLIRERNQKALKEVEIAGQLQQKLLPIPTLPEDTPFDLFSARTSAKEASGDYIDAHLTDNGDLYLICADVMGKGLPAALLGAMLRTAFSINAGRNPSLEKLIHNLNKTVCTQTSNAHIFATCSAAFIPKDGSEIQVVNAGHCPPLLFKENKIAQQVEPSGPPLGIFEDNEYEVETIPFSKENSLLMFTDGLFEWQTGGKIWDWDNFIEWLPLYISNSQRLWATLQLKIQGESDPGSLNDDQTMLHFKLK